MAAALNQSTCASNNGEGSRKIEIGGERATGRAKPTSIGNKDASTSTSMSAGGAAGAAASGSQPSTTTAAAAAAAAAGSQPPSAGDGANASSATGIGALSSLSTPSSSSPLNNNPPPPPTTSSSFPATNEIWPLITAATQRALENKALCPIDTSLVPERLSDGGWSFVLRVASNLRSKDDDGKEQKRKEDAASASASAASSPERENTRQRSPSPSKSPPPPVFNPFLPFDQRLWVSRLPPSHELLLNKFPVSMNHALVVTRDFEEQEDALNAADLRATWAVLDSMPGAGGMAFFNRGRESGASQRHKHLQVVPLPLDGREGGNGGGAADWAPFEGVALAATAAAGAAPLSVVSLKGEDDGNGLPFRAFAARMPPRGGPSAEALEKCVAELVEAACGKEKKEGEDFSFNLLLTRRVAVVIPRRSGRSGVCCPNAVAFAGSMLARSEEELEYVRGKGPMAILGECGMEW